jgi:polyribonucleotide nucleotidyltransferase
MDHTVVRAPVGEKELIIETGRLAKQADGAAVVTYGETVVIVTAVASNSTRDELDFFPLTVDYREKAAAAGKFPGGYFKREGRPTEKEILTARMIDRPCRPLFPEGFYNDTQIMAILLSADAENDPDMLAINGASAALSISDIPWHGPVGAVRVIRVGPVHCQSDAHPAQGRRSGSGVRRQRQGTGDDRRLSQGDFRGRHDEGHRIRPCGGEEDRGGHSRIGAESRQAEARSQTYTRPVRKSSRLRGNGWWRGSRRLLTSGKLAREAAIRACKDKATEGLKQKFADITDFEIKESFAQGRIRSGAQFHSQQQQTAGWPRRPRPAADLRCRRHFAAHPWVSHFSAW